MEKNLSITVTCEANASAFKHMANAMTDAAVELRGRIPNPPRKGNKRAGDITRAADLLDVLASYLTASAERRTLDGQ